MQSDHDSTPVTSTQSLPASTPTRPQRLINLSDSDSDSDLDNDNGDQSYLAGLNVPERLKNILRYKDIGSSGGNNDGEDNSDSDNDGDLFMLPTALRTPDPSSTAATTPKAAATPTITTNSTVRLAPIEKETPRPDQQNRFEQLLALALGDSTDDDTDNDDKGKKKRQTKKTTTKKSTSSKKTETCKKKAPKKRKSPKGKKATGTKPDDDDEDERSDSSASSATNSNSGSSSTTPASKRKGKSTKGTKKKDAIGLALLEETDDSDSDDEGPRRSKQLSRKARLETEREKQRLRRAAHVKLQPRMVRKTMEDLVKKLQDDEDDESETRTDDLEEVQPYQTTGAHQSSPTRVSLYDKYKKELHRLERFKDDNMGGAGSSGDDDDDDGLIIVNTETRGTRFLKTLMSAMSPESPNKTKRSWNKSPSSPLALRTLNQQLMAKMGQEQQAYRQQGIEKAKALGLYVTPEDRAKQYLEREQEAAVLDLEVQRLLYRKATQQNQRRSNDGDDDEDYTPGNDNRNDEGGLVLSGEEDDGDEGSDQAGDDSDNDGPVFLKRRNKLVRKQKNPFLLEDSDDDDQAKARQQKAPKAPEPANSIANFFKGSKLDEDDLTTESSDGPRSLTRLMQRSTLIEDDSDNMNSDGLDDDRQQTVEKEDPPTVEQDSDSELPSIFSTPIPRKPKEQNDFVEEEAEEEEDEFFGLGGPDVAESADLDRFEDDGMVVQDNNETVDSAELRAEYQKNMLESDQHMVERLIKDITGGGLRRKRAAAAAGLLLDDYDLFDDDEDTDDLVALRMSLANKRKKAMKGDPMTHLATDPKTAAFARAAMPVPESLDLSGDEMDEDDGREGDDQDGVRDDVVISGSNGAMVDLEDSDEDDGEEEIKVSINMVVGDYTEPWTRRSDGSTVV